MTAWGTGAFENDDAADWLWELDGVPGLAMVRSALEAASEEGYLEADEASVILAAAEVVATCLGAPPEKVPEEVEDFCAEMGTQLAGLAEPALLALRRVQSNSELMELWEKENSKEWSKYLDDLTARLESVS